jgi:hypothetical protein
VPPRLGVDAARRVFRFWEPAYVPSSFSSCRSSRTRWQPGQAHHSVDPSHDLCRNTARVVVDCAPLRAAAVLNFSSVLA